MAAPDATNGLRAAGFRLGATSYVIPAGWADNVEWLQGLVRDVEVLLFEVEGEGALPDARECARLAQLRADAGLSYSLHTPLAASLASADEARREASVALVLRAIDAARAFAPELFVVHVYFGDGERDPCPPRDGAAFRTRAARSLAAILDAGVPPARLCVELLDYDFALIEPVIAELGVSVALDVGHLERDGHDALPWLDRLLPRTAAIQWHGTEPGGRDHRSLRHYPEAKALALLEALLVRDYRGVLTLEVFDAADLHESLALVHGWLARLGARAVLPAGLSR
jgi:sugar phosphate isomerase/epimerase